MGMNKANLIDAYESWLNQFRWSLYGTLTFRGSPSATTADRIFRQWISEMKQEDGAKDFRWFRVTEHGAYGDNLHFHAVIGGLRDGSKWPWMLRWDELAGSADIFYYRPYAGGLPYMLKTARPDRDFEIEFELPAITHSRAAR
jgi:hypothetical protein